VTVRGDSAWPRLNKITQLCADPTHPRDGREVPRWEE
jgi:hypothetical protein